MSDLKRYIAEKLSSCNIYVVAGVVGTFINLYGHLLVPFFRGEANPIDLQCRILSSP